MVSQSPAADSTRDRLLAAAAAEFAARGFEGAKVDRIAARARVNKAMIYYHFKSKAGLYRDILRGVFGAIADAVAPVRNTTDSPETQIKLFIEAIADITALRPHFPAIWMREILEGGRHVDAGIVGEISRVMQTLAAILQDGRKQRVFGPVHPLVVQMSIVGPLLFFAATSAVRERYKDRAPGPVAALSRADVVKHVQATTLAALTMRDRTATTTKRRRTV